MRFVSRALLAGGLGLAAALVTACGSGSDLLSSTQASTLTALLSRASTAVSNGDCTSADAELGRLQSAVANLPASVNPTLVSDLSVGASTVRKLAQNQCRGSAGTGSATTTATSTVPTTTNTTPTTTSTQTQTQTTTTTITTPSTPSTATTPPATTTTDTGTTTTGTGGGAPVPGAGTGGVVSGIPQNSQTHGRRNARDNGHRNGQGD